MSNGMDNTFNYLSRNNCSGLDNSQAELAASKIKIENLLTEVSVIDFNPKFSTFKAGVKFKNPCFNVRV